MIARTWRGWTTPFNADAYENFLKQKVIPQLSASTAIAVWRLRRDLAHESEFVVINYFDSIEAVQRFAGENYTVPVFEPEAREAALAHRERSPSLRGPHRGWIPTG